jgi:class 3 adenylate cyclase
MGADEEVTVRDLKDHQSGVLPMIGEHGGRIIDTAGDGILAEFGSVVNAVECALAIQKTMAERNANIDPARRMRFRIGVNLGDVIHDEVRVYGDGLNVAPSRPAGTLSLPLTRTPKGRAFTAASTAARFISSGEPSPRPLHF